MDPSSRRRQRHSGAASPLKHAVQQCSPGAVRSPSRRCRTGFCGACTGRPTDLRPPRQRPGQRPLSQGQRPSVRAGPSSSRHSWRHRAGGERSTRGTRTRRRRTAQAGPAVGSRARRMREGAVSGTSSSRAATAADGPGGLALRAVPSGRACVVGGSESSKLSRPASRCVRCPARARTAPEALSRRVKRAVRDQRR